MPTQLTRNEEKPQVHLKRVSSSPFPGILIQPPSWFFPPAFRANGAIQPEAAKQRIGSGRWGVLFFQCSYLGIKVAYFTVSISWFVFLNNATWSRQKLLPGRLSSESGSMEPRLSVSLNQTEAQGFLPHHVVHISFTATGAISAQTAAHIRREVTCKSPDVWVTLNAFLNIGTPKINQCHN